MTRWRLVASGPGPGAWNLALDDAIFAAVRDGRSPPTLRVYGWAPPALTIGYGQDRDRDVDLAACAARGIPVLRRSTGGRAVLHDREVTYSVAVPAGLAPFGRTLDDACRAVAAALVAALRELGVGEARAAAGRRAVPPGARPADCFAAPSRHEVVAAGRKVVGSAQRREGGAFLQHGSILLARPGGLGAGLLRGGGAPDGAAGLDELCGPRGPREVAAALVRGAALAWGATCEPGEPTAREREDAARIAGERYGSAAWNAAPRAAAGLR